MHKYALHGKLTAKPGMAADLEAILLRAAVAVATVKGCLVYLIGRDQDDPDSLWVTEVWDSKEDHDNSLKKAEIKAVIAEAMPLIAEPPRKGLEWEVVGGWGLNS